MRHKLVLAAALIVTALVCQCGISLLQKALRAEFVTVERVMSVCLDTPRLFDGQLNFFGRVQDYSFQYWPVLRHEKRVVFVKGYVPLRLELQYNSTQTHSLDLPESLLQRIWFFLKHKVKAVHKTHPADCGVFIHYIFGCGYHLGDFALFTCTADHTSDRWHIFNMGSARAGDKEAENDSEHDYEYAVLGDVIAMVQTTSSISTIRQMYDFDGPIYHMALSLGNNLFLSKLGSIDGIWVLRLEELKMLYPKANRVFGLRAPLSHF